MLMGLIIAYGVVVVGLCLGLILHMVYVRGAGTTITRYQTMTKFKVGDRVRCVTKEGSNYTLGGTGYDAYTLGKTYTIKSIDPDATYLQAENVLWGEWARCFELVEPMQSKESELGRLIRQANVGVEAAMILAGDYNQHVRSADFANPDWRSIPNQNVLYRSFLVMTKPVFETFRVGGTGFGGWLVELKGDTLHIGCKEFEARKLKSDLVFVTSGEGRNYNLKGTRAGVHYDDYAITWTDADRILAALTKAGVK